MKTLPPETIQAYESILTELIDSSDGIQAAIISTIDGHCVQAHNAPHISGERLSAMTSSLLALGETLAVEIQHNLCNFVIVDNKDGYLVTLKIKDEYLLSTIARRSINLGMLLSSSRIAAENLAKVL